MYWRMRDAERQKSESETQSAVLRKAAAYLAIRDRKLVHGYQIFSDEPEPFSWKGRLFLPPGHHFRMNVVCGDIPPEGMPVIKPHVTNIAPSGEFVVTLHVNQFVDKNWEIFLQFQNEQLDLNKGILRVDPVYSYNIPVPISSSMTEKFRLGHKTEASSFGVASIETAEPDKVIVLLRERHMKKTGNGGWSIAKEPMPGIMIWLEEKK
jgi:hypothetical protein